MLSISNSSHVLTRAARLVLIVSSMTFACVACDGRSPAGPSEITPAPTQFQAPAPILTRITPATGRPDGSTPVRIDGDNFLPGAIVTVGGAATDIEVFNRAILFATTLPHVAAQVDVVVTNPDGQSGTLRGGYTYALATKGPPPTISSIVPAVGIVGGGTYVVVAGNGFREGATVTFDGEPMRANLHYGNQEFFLQTRARGHGTVDVVVTNPDGEGTTLLRGFTFVAPESLDLDGHWEGHSGDHWEIPFQFTIENRTLTVASCGGAAATRFSPPPSTARGEFTLVQQGVGSISGKFFADSYGTGTVDIPGCAGRWEMWKK